MLKEYLGGADDYVLETRVAARVTACGLVMVLLGYAIVGVLLHSLYQDESRIGAGHSMRMSFISAYERNSNLPLSQSIFPTLQTFKILPVLNIPQFPHNHIPVVASCSTSKGFVSGGLS